MKHVVEYTERELGWGGEVWYTEYDTLNEANAMVKDTNDKNVSKTAPSYYIIAKYMGLLSTTPKGYKIF